MDLHADSFKMKTICVFFIVFILSTFSKTNAQVAEVKSLSIGEHKEIVSTHLNQSRVLNISLPDNYNPADTVKYPVIYILDGGVQEDFLHILGIVRFNTQPWIDRFKQSIVVGIEGNNRRYDFTFPVEDLGFIEKENFDIKSFKEHGASHEYIKFIENELQPFIDRNYKTNQTKTIIGESLAGLLATEILLKHSHLFNQYIIIAPSLWWGDRRLLDEARKFNAAKLQSKKRVYIGVPNKEEDLKMYSDAEQLFHILEGQKNIDLFFDHINNEIHSTVIHQAVYNAFKVLYPNTTYSK